MFLPMALMPQPIEDAVSGQMALNEAGRTGKTYVDGVPRTLKYLSDPLALTSAARLVSKDRGADKGDDDSDRPSGPSFYDLTRDRHFGSQPQLADYLDAPWATAYGMSKETAYSEAMENTAYRRSVADMQKAGLNPAVIFGAGRGSTAGSPSYISSGSSGSSGRVSRRGSGGSRSNGKLFSGSAYSIISALGGIVGAAATHSAGGYWIGTSLAQGAMSALNAFSGGRR